MNIYVDKKIFIKYLKNAISSKENFEVFRDFIFDKFYAEDEYTFEDESIEVLFEQFTGYFDYKESSNNPDLRTRFQRILKTLENNDWELESVVFAFELDEIKILNEKLNSQKISLKIYNEQLKKLTSLKIDIGKLKKLIKTKR